MLRHEGVVLPLGGRSRDILINLAERPGEIVAEKELSDRAWSAAAIEGGAPAGSHGGHSEGAW